ncbi:inosine-guanosine kinase [Escherichia coli]|uniref:Inosine-guanosine kinase n=1 Tax=Escherichia coli TaxID=562 RepID=A0A376YCC1_ECOLX|nr:inosine-guanosine kinase [Escherichia coli]
MKAIEYAKKYNVPGGADAGHQVCHCRESAVVAAIPQDHVSILAMNEDEAEALTGEAIRCWHLTRRWTG